MDRRRRILFVIGASLALPVLSVEAAYADPALEVSATTDLLDYDTVTVTGSGFAPGTSIGYCEAIDDGTPDVSDCGVGAQLVTSDGAGSFTVSIDVRRTFTPGSGVAVDCSDPASSCAIAAAEFDDIPGTVVFTPVSFATPPAPPVTPGSIELQGTQPYGAGEAVTVDGNGFRSGAEIVLLQCPATSLDARGCVGRQYETAAADGSFSTTYEVEGSAFADCGAPGQCVVVAAERVDVAGTLVSAPVRVIAPRQANPDVQLKRRSDGTIFFDNVYDPILQHRIHAIDAGGVWVYAVRIQNDFDTTTDIRLFADNARPGFRIRYFLNYAEFSETVGGQDGFVFRNMAPGEVRLIAVQFEAEPDVAPGTRATAVLSLGRTTVPFGFDGMTLSVNVN